jgi:DNA primase
LAIYPESFLNQIKDKVDIVDLISTYVSVQRKGRDYWACCPFHNEKTPSFQIRSDHQFYKCYGCSKSGNIFTFMMEYEKMTFPESIEFLAEKAGLEIPEQVVDKEYKERKQGTEKIYSINKEAAKFYFQNLTKKEGETGLTYLLNRGISWDTIQTFGMGYSYDFESLTRHLTKIGYDIKTLNKAGVLTYDGKDFFGERIIIPIISAQGKVIGFTGRSLEKKPDFAKYKNTGATLAFDKKKNLFGINLLKKFTHGNVRSVILVEGHMDVISLYQVDIKNVVASMGTSLTIEQCRELKRYADLVYVSFDGDSAGQSATMRGLELLKEVGLEVKVVDIKDGLDPDDYVRKYGKQGYTTLLDEALPLIDFKLHKVKKKHKLDSYDNRKKYANEAIDVLSGLDSIESAIYADEVSKNSGISKDILIEQIEDSEAKATKKVSKQNQEPKNEQKEDNASIIAARFVLASILYAKNYVDIREMDKSLFVHEKHIAIYDYIYDCLKESKPPKISDLFDILENDSESTKIIDALEDKSIANSAVYYAECVKKLKKDYINREISNTVNLLKTENDDKKIKTLKEKILQLSKPQKEERR